MKKLSLKLENNRKKLFLVFIPLILSAYTHMWNPIGFPSLHVDEGHYLRKTMSTLEGGSLQPQDRYFAPYFGQILLAGFFGLFGYPDILNYDDSLESIEHLYLFPRLLMSFFAIIDTFLIFKIVERRYGFKVALIASILFAVLPYTWLIRRIFLESIQLPLLLTSILFALYIKDNSKPNHEAGNKKLFFYILMSGIFLGLSIFTKIPIFTMIPLVAYLIYTNSNTHKFRNLGLWLIPVLIIPLLWPAHAISIGEFEKWKDDVLHQTTERKSKPLLNSLKTFFFNDPVLFTLGISGIIFAAIKRDLFILLYSIPFLLFLYLIDFVSSFHVIPLLPIFAIAGAKLIVDLSNMIPSVRIKQITPYIIISSIAIFGLVSTYLLISINVNSIVLETHSVLIEKLSESNNSVTLIGNPLYIWMPRHVFDIDYEDRSYFSTRPLTTTDYILISDSGQKKIQKEDSKRGNFQTQLFNNTQIIESIKAENMKKGYNIKNYPYSNMKLNPNIKQIDIHANY